MSEVSRETGELKLTYRSPKIASDPPPLLHALAIVGILVATHRVLLVVESFRTFGYFLSRTEKFTSPSEYTAGHTILFMIVSGILGASLMTACVGILGRHRWGASLLLVTEMSAILFCAVLVIARFIRFFQLGIWRYGTPYATYWVFNYLGWTMGQLVYPLLAFAVVEHLKVRAHDESRITKEGQVEA